MWRLLPLPQPWALLRGPCYQGPGKAQYLAITPGLSRGHVGVVANSPYVVRAIITSMCQLRKPRLGLYQPVERAGSEPQHSGSKATSTRGSFTVISKISCSNSRGPGQLTHLDCFLDHISRPVFSSIKEER